MNYLLTEEQSEQRDSDEGSVSCWFFPSEDRMLICGESQGCFEGFSHALALLYSFPLQYIGFAAARFVFKGQIHH